MPGDRRDHFTAISDVWEIATRIAEVRKSREIDPVLKVLNTCLEEADGDPAVTAEQVKRLTAIHDFTLTMDRWSQQMLRVPPATLMRLIKMGDQVIGLLGLAGKAGGKRR